MGVALQATLKIINVDQFAGYDLLGDMHWEKGYAGNLNRANDCTFN